MWRGWEVPMMCGYRDPRGAHLEILYFVRKVKLSSIGVAKMVGKSKMATSRYYSDKNIASTKLLNRLSK
jgi:hypothetical protein